MPDDQNACTGALDETIERLEEMGLAQDFITDNMPLLVRWLSDPSVADRLQTDPAGNRPPASVEALCDRLAAYFEEAASYANPDGAFSVEELYPRCARQLLETVQRAFSELAVSLFLRIGVDVSDMDAAGLIEAYRDARAQDQTADVGKTLVFYRLCELGGLQGATYADKYRDLVERTNEAN